MEIDQRKHKLVVRSATQEEIFYANLGDEAYKESGVLLVGSLRQIVTLSSAFIGGVVAFYDKKVFTPPFLFFSLMFFILALAISVCGSFPTIKRIQLRAPYEIKESFNETINFRITSLKSSSFFFFLGVGTLFIGSLVGYLTNW